MKWLFILLLIINVGIFAWGYQQEQLAVKPPIAAGADVGDMRLINELNKESDQAATETTSAPVQTEHASEPERLESSEKQAGDSAAEAEQNSEQETATLADTDATPPEGPEVDAVENQPYISDDQKQPQPENPVAGDRVAEFESDTTSRCGAIGPIIDRQVAQEVLDDLGKLKFAPKLETSTKKQQIGYWVVIPHLADSDQAQAMIERLAQAGLRDIWHFRGGELENVISLGVFSKKENAENFSREVLAKGFKTEMQPRYLNKQHYMVKFTITRPKTVTGIMWGMVEKKYSKMPFTEQTCEPIATR